MLAIVVTVSLVPAAHAEPDQCLRKLRVAEAKLGKALNKIYEKCWERVKSGVETEGACAHTLFNAPTDGWLFAQLAAEAVKQGRKFSRLCTAADINTLVDGGLIVIDFTCGGWQPPYTQVDDYVICLLYGNDLPGRNAENLYEDIVFDDVACKAAYKKAIKLQFVLEKFLIRCVKKDLAPSCDDSKYAALERKAEKYRDFVDERGCSRAYALRDSAYSVQSHLYGGQDLSVPSW